uniref:uncharacterized protein LOC101306699 n=1 Tax=Fragaria vesca subsp. vesca TaxID=101020 RepID=UPI0005C8AAA5|nr:PREDICTED: uncharacterized protein LOC101306699 [Fragaria vesca subsp. vesca]
METLIRVVVCSSFPATPPIPPRSLTTRNPSVSALITTPSPVSEVAEEDVLQTFFKERKSNGDFVSRLSDDVDDAGGFLKLSATNEWVLGDRSAPMNKKAIVKAMQNDSERRKKLYLLQYEAGRGPYPIGLQTQMLSEFIEVFSLSLSGNPRYLTFEGLKTLGTNAFVYWYWTACTEYCLITLSFQGAISYATGVLFSCLYLKLLYQHVDNISREAVPQIFRQKKSKKIGIRSQDLEDSLEKLIKGCGMALPSPRLVLPAAIYGLWILSHQYISSDLFDFQLVPTMVGLFVYKATALVQVYRDNEDLQLIFPDDI